nr:hypothetical protein CFP56_22514 [Quercus suber]
MPEAQLEPDSLLRNLRLVASEWNFFVFVASPALSWSYYLYQAFHLSQESIIPPRARFLLGLSCPVIAVLLAYTTSSTIRARLQERGFEQRRAQGRQMDFMLNVAICVAGYYWLQRWDTEDDIDPAWLYVHLVLGGILFTASVFLMTLGPIIWFTVRTR